MITSNAMAMKLTAQATTVSSGDIDNASGFGGHIVCDVTAMTGTIPTVVFTVEGKDAVSGKYYNILVSASIGATGTTVLKVFPAAVAAANVAAGDFLPRVIRITATIGGTTPAITATVGVNFYG